MLMMRLSDYREHHRAPGWPELNWELSCRTEPAHCRVQTGGELDAAMSLQLTLHANDYAGLMITVSRKTIIQIWTTAKCKITLQKTKGWLKFRCLSRPLYEETRIDAKSSVAGFAAYCHLTAQISKFEYQTSTHRPRLPGSDGLFF